MTKRNKATYQKNDPKKTLFIVRKKESLCVDSPIVVPGTFLMMLFLALLLEKRRKKKTEKPFSLKGCVILKNLTDQKARVFYG